MTTTHRLTSCHLIFADFEHMETLPKNHWLQAEDKKPLFSIAAPSCATQLMIDRRITALSRIDFHCHMESARIRTFQMTPSQDPKAIKKWHTCIAQAYLGLLKHYNSISPRFYGNEQSQLLAVLGKLASLRQTFKMKIASGVNLRVSGAPDDLVEPSFFSRFTPLAVAPVYSAINTALSMVRAGWRQPIFEFFPEDDKLGHQRRDDLIDRVAVPGRMLNNATMIRSASLLDAMNHFQRITTFINSTIDQWTLNEMVACIKEQLDQRPIGDQRPVCIFFVSRVGFSPIQHITMAWVQNNRIYYYDSKGGSSQNKPLKMDENGKPSTLFEALQKTAEYMHIPTTGSFLTENSVRHQWDIHRCGFYVLFFIFKVLVDGQNPENIMNRQITAKALHNFRLKLPQDLVSEELQIENNGFVSI